MSMSPGGDNLGDRGGVGEHRSGIRRYQLQMIDPEGHNRVTMESNFLTKAHFLAIYLQKTGRFTGRLIDILQHGEVIFTYQPNGSYHP